MLQYIVFLIVMLSLVYNHFRKRPLLKNTENQRIEKVFDNVGVENVMKSLNSDEEFRKVSKELDETLTQILKREN